MYYSENPVLDLLLNRLKILLIQVKVFNKSMKDNRLVEIEADGEEDRIIFRLRAYPIKLPSTISNEIVNKFFFSV